VAPSPEAGRLQRARKPTALCGLNVNHNHDPKNLFESTATRELPAIRQSAPSASSLAGGTHAAKPQSSLCRFSSNWA